MRRLNQVRKNIARWFAAGQSELCVIDSVTLKSENEAVYNFATETHTYCLGSGLVVHNCDTVSMLLDMDPYVPSTESTPEFVDSEDGTFAFMNDDDGDIYKNSTIF